MLPKVSIILVNWNNWKDTIECLESLYQIEYPNYEIILVDNGSVDKSIEQIKNYSKGIISVKSKFIEKSVYKPIKLIELTKNETQSLNGTDKFYQSKGKRLFLIKNNKNYGFTEGNNIGMKFALKNLSPDYILLLNNDTVVENKFLDYLIEEMESDVSIGFAGSKIYYYDFKGSNRTIQYAGGIERMHRLTSLEIGNKQVDDNQFNHNRYVDFIHGSCILARVKTIKEIGLLDIDLFSYKEENDWCLRAKKKGWRSRYVSKSKIWHKGGGSTIKKGKKHIYAYYIIRNKIILIKKHANLIQSTFFTLFFIFFDFWFASIVFLLYNRNKTAFKCFLKGIIDGIKLQTK